MKNTLALSIFALIGMTISAHAATDIMAGKKIYDDNCKRCHGVTAGGGIGKKLKGDAAFWPAATFNRAVLTGIDDEGRKMKVLMPVWGKTGLTKPKGVLPTDADLSNVQAYLQSLGPKAAN